MILYTYTESKRLQILSNLKPLRAQAYSRDLTKDVMFKEYLKIPWVERAVVTKLFPWPCKDLIIQRMPVELHPTVINTLSGSKKTYPKTMRLDALFYAYSKSQPQKSAWINIEMQPEFTLESLAKSYNYICALEMSMLQRGGLHKKGSQRMAVMFVNQDLRQHKNRPKVGLEGDHYLSTEHNFWHIGASFTMIEIPNHRKVAEEITSDFDGVMHIIGMAPDAAIERFDELLRMGGPVAKATEEYSNLFPTLEQVRIWKALQDHADREALLEKRGEKKGKIEGKIEGKQEEKEEIARKLLRAQVDLNIIAQSTGLDKESLATLAKAL